MCLAVRMWATALCRRVRDSRPEETAAAMAWTTGAVRPATVDADALNSTMSAPARSAWTAADGTEYPAEWIAVADSESVRTRPPKPSRPRRIVVMTVADRLAGRPVSPGTDALAIMTAGTPARMAAANASSPSDSRVDQGSVAAATLSVLPLAPPSPGERLTTGDRKST